MVRTYWFLKCAYYGFMENVSLILIKAFTGNLNVDEKEEFVGKITNKLK